MPKAFQQAVSWNSRLVFRAAAAVKGKSTGNCEDAHFVSEVSMGVADGVSAWRHYGVDSGEFARSLMQECSTHQPRLKGQAVRKELTEALAAALGRVEASGSCTALLAYLFGCHLYITALGDSRAALIRREEGRPGICFKTPEMVHCANTPYQLARIPPQLDSRKFISDSPQDALHYELTPRRGDLLVMGTDGLWDNISMFEMIHILETVRQPQEVADRLRDQAYINSISCGPGLLDIPQLWRGGKVDDITVVAASIDYGY